MQEPTHTAMPSFKSKLEQCRRKQAEELPAKPYFGDKSVHKNEVNLTRLWGHPHL